MFISTLNVCSWRFGEHWTKIFLAVCPQRWMWVSWFFVLCWQNCCNFKWSALISFKQYILVNQILYFQGKPKFSLKAFAVLSLSRVRYYWSKVNKQGFLQDLQGSGIEKMRILKKSADSLWIFKYGFETISLSKFHFRQTIISNPYCLFLGKLILQIMYREALQIISSENGRFRIRHWQNLPRSP